MRMEVLPYTSDLWARLASAWTGMFRYDAGASVFCSPAWVSSWLEIFGEETRPEGWVWRDEAGGAVGVVLVGTRPARIGPIRVRRAYLNATGEHAVASEHNDFLVLSEHRDGFADEIVERIRKMGVDELALTGFRLDAAMQIRERWPSRRWEGYESEAPYVDLERVRASGGDYLASLSGNTRSKVRRSFRIYSERSGPPALRVASDRDEAADWLDQMIALHDARWRSRGLPGAFASDRVRRFHSRLLGRVFDGGSDTAVDLVRIQFGDELVGILYNLRRGGVVSFYQSGFRYESDKRLKPGLVAHALAIQHYTEAGAREYDFLGGEAEAVQYKRSLSSDTRRLVWSELAASSWRMRAIGLARAARALYRGGRPTRTG